MPSPAHVELRDARAVPRLNPGRWGAARHRADCDPAGIRMLIPPRRPWNLRNILQKDRRTARTRCTGARGTDRAVRVSEAHASGDGGVTPAVAADSLYK